MFYFEHFMVWQCLWVHTSLQITFVTTIGREIYYIYIYYNIIYVIDDYINLELKDIYV